MNKLLIILFILHALESARGASVNIPFHDPFPAGQDEQQKIFSDWSPGGFKKKPPSICTRSRKDSSTQLIVCSNKKLTAPPELPELTDVDGVIELDLRNNALRETPDMTAKGYKSVSCLNLAGNRIERVTENVVSPKLKHLFLHDNNIKSIDEAVLDKIRTNSNIIILTVHRNPMKSCDWTRDMNLVRRDLVVSILTCGNGNYTVDESCNTEYFHSDGMELRSSIFTLSATMIGVITYLFYVD